MPDDGSKVEEFDSNRRRRALIAGLVTTPGGVLGSPTVARPTLG
jgi:hypothetical protein